MIAVLIGVLFTVSAVNEADVANRAASLAARGQRTDARRLLAPLVASSNASALLAMAFIELEEAHVDAASRLAKRLASLKPGHPEVVILTKLVEERSRAPGDPWMNVAARAWNAAGRPQGAPEPILAPIDVQKSIDDTAIARLRGTRNGFLLAFGEAAGDYQNLIDSALAQAEAVDCPLAVQLVALRVLLDTNLPERKRAQARSMAVQLVTQIARSHPEDGYLGAALPLFGMDGDAPLTAPELAMLEESTQRLKFELPYRLLYEAFRAAYELVDPGQASSRAMSAATSAIPLQVHVLFSRRSTATSDVVLRGRAAGVLSAAGSRLAADPTLLDRMVGLAMQTKGAELRRDVQMKEAVERTRNELRALIAAGSAFWAHPWPIHSLLKEHFERATTDEVRYYESLFK